MSGGATQSVMGLVGAGASIAGATKAARSSLSRANLWRANSKTARKTRSKRIDKAKNSCEIPLLDRLRRKLKNLLVKVS